MEEQALPGGYVTEVVRVGDTVRRTPPPDPAFVHELLGLFERRGWPGAPRFLGHDEQGREVLTYVAGHVAWAAEQPATVTSPASLAQVAELVREFHDLTAGTPLAGDQEVVCHNDLSPRNTVYRDDGGGLAPVAFIDWDIAAPGARIHDVAFVCWQYLDLGPGITDVAAAGRGLRLICDAYGLDDRRPPDSHDLVVAGPVLARHRGRRCRGRPGDGGAARPGGRGLRAGRGRLGQAAPGRARRRAGRLTGMRNGRIR